MAEPDNLRPIGMMVPPAPRPLKIGIAVGKGQSGKYALKWALEKLVPPNGSVHLLHVMAPLRLIPNPMGGSLPLDQVHPDIVKTFKDQHLSEAYQLVSIYRTMCNKKKVNVIVSYSESDSIQKELVNQVSKLGVTKLVVGMSSQNVISRAFKKESISAFVAKNSPDFCTVMVASKGKLISVKNATEASCVSSSSESGSTDTSIRSMQDGVIMSNDDMDNFSLDALSDSSRSPSGCLLSQSMSSTALFDRQPAKLMMRNHSTPSQFYKHVAATAFHQPCISYDSIDRLNRRFGNRMSFDEGNQAESSEYASNIAAKGHPNGPTSAAVANGSSGGSLDAPESICYPEVHVLSPTTMEVLNCHSTMEGSSFQRSLLVPQNISMVSSVASTNGEVDGYEGCRNEMLQQGEKETTNKFKEVKYALQIALRDQALLQESLEEEIRRHQATRKELERQRKTVSMFVNEVESAKQGMEAERRSHEETITKLEEVNQKLQRECDLRREAEERASNELAEKLEVLAALRKEQQRYSEYSFRELQLATNDFHEDNKLGEGGYGPVYRGKLHHTMVAIKVLAQDGWRGREEFQKEVELLSRIHHPHMLMLLGACPEKGCIIYEYMGNGSLEDCLACRGGTAPLPWYIRFRLCLEVSTALLFLHSQPQPIVHRDLKPANILLDHHFVSKIGDVGIAKLVPNNLTFSVTTYKDSVPVGTFAYIDPDYLRTGLVSCESDVYALGIVMLQLLTGRPALGITHLVEEAIMKGQLAAVLDMSAGEWPLMEALDLALLSLRCAEYKRRDRPKLEIDILPKLEAIQVVAERAAASTTSAAGPSSSGMKPIIPSFFFCPIYQEVMENPHIAADGFTYEYEAIKVWLQANNTSPMTNLRLEHKSLTPNHAIRSAIREWYDSGLIPR